eukprot:TRINITY_DN10818_c0_g1_i1.p3 TRINITY_DN10818_c0_g1~~TRINITY_DN10818_c0_g1_i1.p3  ORF type:complete len:166 (-),score=24.26 TRINITY_DN10818_c0_g1_i1:2-499(-)
MAATNAFRAGAGLPALAPDGAMLANARAHSAAMAARGSLYHQTIGALPALASGVKIYAENVAMGSAGVASGAAVGRQVVTQWKNSAGHRRNMLRDAGDTEMVVGIHIDGGGAVLGHPNVWQGGGGGRGGAAGGGGAAAGNRRRGQGGHGERARDAGAVRLPGTQG